MKLTGQRFDTVVKLVYAKHSSARCGQKKIWREIFRKTRRNKEHEENVVTYVDEMRRSCNKVLRKIAKPDLGA